MPEGFELFDKHGQFVHPTEEQIASLDPATRERWASVRDAYAVSKEIDDALAASNERITGLMKDVRDAERYLQEHYPAQTREAAVRDYLATERQKTLARRGLL